MHKVSKFIFPALIAMFLLPVSAAMAAPATPDEKAKDAVLRRLDVAAANFHSTSADFEFDSVETDPIPYKDVQKGTVFYERKNSAFQMAAHIRELNGKISSKVYSYTSGVLKLYEKLTNQVTRFSKASQYESYLMLGFGASGKDLEQKWEIKYLGPETLDGVRTEKLELVARDATVRKNIPKVTIWVDTGRAVSLKQVFDEGPGQYRVCFYFNIKTNQPLPADAFAFKTDKQTVLVDR
jgi:outer membrane lipoprotein-sorting protein